MPKAETFDEIAARRRPELIALIAEAKAKIKALEADSAIWNAELLENLFGQGDTEATTAEWTVRIQNTRSSKIVPERLIAAGVDSEIVKAATVETVSKPFLRFYPVTQTEG